MMIENDERWWENDTKYKERWWAQVADCLLRMDHWAKQFSDPCERAWFRAGLPGLELPRR